MNFNVGDKVRIIADEFEGDTGTVIETDRLIHNYAYEYLVRVNVDIVGNLVPFDADELELVED